MKDSDQSIRKRRAGSRTLLPKGGNDRVYTPDALALDIVLHFRPSGRILEPSCGGGAFLRALPGCDWCEIDLGVDFLACTAKYDWIVTNPPYSILTQFLAKSVETADNIVFLCPTNSWFQVARERVLSQAGFGIVEICNVPHPPKPWPTFGLSLSATRVQRGWTGSISKTRLPSNLWPPNGSHKMAVPAGGTVP